MGCRMLCSAAQHRLHPELSAEVEALRESLARITDLARDTSCPYEDLIEAIVEEAGRHGGYTKAYDPDQASDGTPLPKPKPVPRATFWGGPS